MTTIKGDEIKLDSAEIDNSKISKETIKPKKKVIITKKKTPTNPKINTESKSINIDADADTNVDVNVDIKKVEIKEVDSIFKNKDDIDMKDINMKKEQDKEDKREVLVDLKTQLPTFKNKKTSCKIEPNPLNIFNPEDVDYRYIMMNYDFTKNKTMAKITKYEKALLIGKRAKQIEEGAIPNVKVLPGQSVIQIAEEELRQRKIPFIIKRPIGNTYEYWRPVDMEVNMD